MKDAFIVIGFALGLFFGILLAAAFMLPDGDRIVVTEKVLVDKPCVCARVVERLACYDVEEDSVFCVRGGFDLVINDGIREPLYTK